MDVNTLHNIEHILMYREICSKLYIGQWIEEISYFIDKAREYTHPISTVVEIGCAQGANLLYLSRLITSDGYVIGITLPGEEDPRLAIEPHIDTIIDMIQPSQFECIYGNSNDPDTLDRFVGVLGDRQIDVLFIDGEHDYKESRMDYDLYGPMVREGGIIAFHDINYATRNDCTLVFQEVASHYRSDFIGVKESLSTSIFDGDGGMVPQPVGDRGIGIVYK